MTTQYERYLQDPVLHHYMKNDHALRLGYSPDRRKRRAQHRQAVRSLRDQGGGSIIRSVVAWHLHQARRP